MNELQNDKLYCQFNKIYTHISVIITVNITSHVLSTLNYPKKEPLHMPPIPKHKMFIVKETSI